MGTPAARVGDPIAHSNAMTGLLIGAALGAALAVATVATGGLAAVAAGALIAGGVAGGALAGEYIGAASMGPPTGALSLGSPNVFINSQPAAMATLALGVCAKESGAPQPVAMGAATVYINGMPAARQGDKLVCSAVILKGSHNVFVDDATQQTLALEPEVPAWLETTLQVVVIGAAVVGFGAAIAAVGVGMATAGLVGGLVGGALGGKGGRALGEALGLSEAQTRALETAGGLLGGVVGGAAATRAVQGVRNTTGLGRNANNQPTPRSDKVCTSGCPISMHTGEELLSSEDFVWDGPLPLVWRRFYRTAQSGIDLQLGHGWVTPVDEWVEAGDDGTLVFHDQEGRRIVLPLPDDGGQGRHAAEQITVERRGDELCIVPERGPQRLFRLGPGRCRLQAWREAGHRIDIAGDREGRPVALHASWGRSLLIDRAGHRIAAIVPAETTPAGLVPTDEPLVRYRYSTRGDLTRVLDALGAGERYAYAGHVLRRRTLASGFSFHFAWDQPGPQGRCVRNWGDDGIHDFHFEWNDTDGASRATDSCGGVSTWWHDAAGRLLRLRSAEGLCERFGYDAQGLLVEHAGPGDAVRRYAYDADGRLVRQTDALGQVHHITHDAQGRLAEVRDPLGHAWQWQWDDQGRLTLARDPLGGETRYRYNPQGLLAEVHNPLGQVRTLWWDEQAHLIAELGHDGVRRRYTWDDSHRLRSVVTQDDRRHEFEWDAVGRPTVLRAPDGGRTQLRWNVMGLLTQWRDANGHATEFRYADRLRQPSERIDPLGRVLRYHYDSEHRLVGLTNPKGERLRLVLDLDARVVEQVGFDGRSRRYQYDAGGHLALIVERTPDGMQPVRQTRFERDLLGRLTTRTAADGQLFHYHYDPLGRLLQARREGARLGEAAHEVLVAYDALGRLISEQQDGLLLTHELDAVGRRTGTRLPDGQALRYSWDPQGRLAELELDGQPLTRHRWDAHGQEVGRQQGALHTEFDWDPAGRLQSQRTATQDGTQLLGRRYHHDAGGRLLELDDLRQGAMRFVYDPADQLRAVLGATPEQFVHDPAGNLLDGDAGAAPAAPGDRLALWGDRHFRHDSAGNRIEERGGKGGHRRRRYVYDAEHRLSSVHGPEGSSHYRYDALGRRVAKLTPHGETHFVWDGPTLVGELRLARPDAAANAAQYDAGAPGAPPPGATQRWYVYEPGSFRPLAFVQRRAGATAATEAVPRAEVYHYHLDHLGTPRELTAADGRLVWSARYRAWGALALADVDEVDNPLRFQGQYHDAETGLHYNFHRFYDPDTGRYIHQDPIGLAGGENPYAYGPDPLGWTDPLGLAGDPAQSTHITYEGIKNGKPYIGYASKPGLGQTAESVLAYRYPNTSNFDVAPRPVFVGDGLEGKAVARGLEQRLFEQRGGLQGTSNLQNPVGENNPNRGRYLAAADKHLAGPNPAAGRRGTGTC